MIKSTINAEHLYENMVSKLIVLLTLVSIALTGCNTVTDPKSPAKADAAANKSLYQAYDYKGDTVYVIGHNSPDTDTVCAAITMAYFLNQLGIKATPAISEPVNNETKFVLDYFGVNEPDILDDASGKNIWMVDHTALSQSVKGTEEANIVGVTDHHNFDSLFTLEVANIIAAPVGSTTSLIFREFKNCNIEIPRDMAGLMLSGLISDTNNLAGNQIEFDVTCQDELAKLSKVDDIDKFYQDMLAARLSFEGMTDKEIFYNDYKEYECNDVTYGIANVEISSADELKDMSERLAAVMNEEVLTDDLDILFYAVKDAAHTGEYFGYAGKDKAYSANIFESVCEKLDGCTMENETAFLTDTVSRKKTLVPLINEMILKQ